MHTNIYIIYTKYQAAAGPGRGPGLGPGRAGRRLVFRIYILYVFVHVLIGLPGNRARWGCMQGFSDHTRFGMVSKSAYIPPYAWRMIRRAISTRIMG